MMLKEKIALVTGGSRGIGKEIVLQFLQNGATVYFLDLIQSEFSDEMEKIAKEAGGSVFFKKTDVSNEEEITEVTNKILKEAGRIDILVNNAGITRDGLIFRMKSEDWNKVLTINLTSAFYTSRIVARHMAKQRSGSIINIASIVGIGGNAGQTNYAASKAGIIGFSKSLAKEVGSRGVRVNAVAPGYIATPMTKALGDKVKEAMLAQIPLGRMGKPEEVAQVVTFLASDQSTYITGRVIQVDGGMAI